MKKGRATRKVEKSQSKGKRSEKKRKRSQGPGSQVRKVESVNMKEVVDSLRNQAVLVGRIFDMGIITLPSMDSLHDMVEIQSWLHLFNRKSPILHEEEVREFYYNVQFKEDGSILTRVNDIVVHLDEGVLRKILRVPREGTWSVLGRTFSSEFAAVISKTPTTKVAGIYKKIMKSEYQLVFEFINKVLLPRTKKRTVAAAANLFVMEMLCSFKALNLPGLMFEHIHKTVIERKGVHGWVTDTFSRRYSGIFKFLLVWEKWGQLSRLSPNLPWLSANALK